MSISGNIHGHDSHVCGEQGLDFRSFMAHDELDEFGRVGDADQSTDNPLTFEEDFFESLACNEEEDWEVFPLDYQVSDDYCEEDEGIYLDSPHSQKDVYYATMDEEEIRRRNVVDSLEEAEGVIEELLGEEYSIDSYLPSFSSNHEGPRKLDWHEDDAKFFRRYYLSEKRGSGKQRRPKWQQAAGRKRVAKRDSFRQWQVEAFNQYYLEDREYTAEDYLNDHIEPVTKMRGSELESYEAEAMRDALAFWEAIELEQGFNFYDPRDNFVYRIAA